MLWWRSYYVWDKSLLWIFYRHLFSLLQFICNKLIAKNENYRSDPPVLYGNDASRAEEFSVYFDPQSVIQCNIQVIKFLVWSLKFFILKLLIWVLFVKTFITDCETFKTHSRFVMIFFSCFCNLPSSPFAVAMFYRRLRCAMKRLSSQLKLLSWAQKSNIFYSRNN